MLKIHFFIFIIENTLVKNHLFHPITDYNFIKSNYFLKNSTNIDYKFDNLNQSKVLRTKRDVSHIYDYFERPDGSNYQSSPLYVEALELALTLPEYRHKDFKYTELIFFLLQVLLPGISSLNTGSIYDINSDEKFIEINRLQKMINAKGKIFKLESKIKICQDSLEQIQNKFLVSDDDEIKSLWIQYNEFIRQNLQFTKEVRELKSKFKLLLDAQLTFFNNNRTNTIIKPIENDMFDE